MSIKIQDIVHNNILLTELFENKIKLYKLKTKLKKVNYLTF